MSHPRIKDTVQDCNLNFLIGSGLSAPYLHTLGNIETLITDLESADGTTAEKDMVRISLYKHFFESAISANMGIIRKESGAANTLRSYQTFLTELNNILLRRKSTILSKEINLFTTNVDVFLEYALESLNLEVNDGFNGRFNPQFSLSHFKTSRFKKSLHFDNVAELPIFNLLKLHGSLSWQLDGDGRIAFSRDLALVDTTRKALKPEVNALKVDSNSTLASLLKESKEKAPTPEALKFIEAYDELLIVNPTKEKFKHTLLNQTYYELLRIYSNELEKENTVLFALGFSFADEHIREITLRSINSNPTLVVFVVAYDGSAAKEISSRFPAHQIRNNNIFFIEPPLDKPDEAGAQNPKYLHTLDNINRHIFGSLLPLEPEDSKE